MRVAITGGTGMIGTALAAHLRARGDEVVILTRGRPGGDRIAWDPARGVMPQRRMEGLDAIVNLTGAPLAARPWTPRRRQVLRDSRVVATENLLRSLQRLERPPAAFIGVGSLGLFGDRGVGWIDDEDHPASGFLAELAAQWETAHLVSSDVLGCRSAVLRLGVVLGSSGGAFPHLLRAFRYGFGGWLGDGRQYTAWLSLRDTSRAFAHLIDNAACKGVFNGNVPDPLVNKQWCEALAKVVGKQIRTHAPKWALRGAFGELADELLLASCRARPRKLLETDFHFVDGDAEATFRTLAAEIGPAPVIPPLK